MKASTRICGALLLATLGAACGDSPQNGEAPVGPPEGQLVAVSFDVWGNRLFKAYPHAVYQSRDSGRSWTAIPLPPLVQKGQIIAVVTPAKAAGTLYLGGRRFGVIRSQDEGATWRRLNRGLPFRKLEALTAHAELAATLYASVAGDGIYRTEDGGESWKRMDGGPAAQVGQLFHSNLEGSMKTGWLYAGTPDGVQRTMDCFCGWRPAGRLPGQRESYRVVFDSKEPRNLYASGVGGLFRSRDGGENWDSLPGGGAQTVALAFDPAADILYAATGEGVILRSRDQGVHWERVGE